MLKKSLSRLQWCSIATLFIGVTLAQANGYSVMKSEDNIEQNRILGFCAVFVGTILSGFAGVYFEKVLNEASTVSLWMLNVKMLLFTIPASCVAAILQAMFINRSTIVRLTSTTDDLEILCD
ncbi:hypothetical protein AB6A40_011555 [Gnathostoma spinigerum]|uniref:Uncharacterized protein n=1 Tax=Gnathostoma spinigerum TaxID=75299 RepID=A0ABD6EY49_9BILA